MVDRTEYYNVHTDLTRHEAHPTHVLASISVRHIVYLVVYYKQGIINTTHVPV